MTDLSIKKISYGELKEKPIEVKDDRYGIASFFTENIRQTFLACPGYLSDEDTAVLLLLDGDIVVGREIRYGTRIKIGDEIVWVHAGCSMMVCDDYQKIGAGIMLLTVDLGKDDKVAYGALYTRIMRSLIKKQKRNLFEIPQYTKIVNTKPIFESKFKLRGTLLKMATWFGNAFLGLLEIPNRLKLKKLQNKYSVKKETIVPEWAGELATNDGHKYMEYHDTKWLQWSLDYTMTEFPEDKQSFYSVWDRTCKPVGFFMTKERFEEEAGIYKNIIRGTIVEWATTDKKLLSEADINLLAVYSFSEKVSNITTVSEDIHIVEKLKKMGFHYNFHFYMSFKDKTGNYADGADMSNWRIRYGCSNSIIY